jgi:hypothetical protein
MKMKITIPDELAEKMALFPVVDRFHASQAPLCNRDQEACI